MPITDEEIISPDAFALLTPRERDEYIRSLQVRAEPWVLTPKQQEFEACALECDETLVGGAAGGSKSEWLLWHTIEQCKRFPRFDALVLRSKLPELQRSLIKRSLLRIPPDVATYNTTKRTWEFAKTRSTIEFGYADSLEDVQQYLSAEYDLLVIDECTEITDEMYVNLRSRVRTTNRKKAKGIRPHTILATNPGGKGHVWVMERFVDPTSRGEFTYLDPETEHRVGFVPSFIKDNPHLDEAYERNLRSLPEIRRKQLLEGNWDVFAGQYFTEWDRAVHVVDPFVIPPEWQRAAGYDYGYSNPMAHLSAAFDNDGNCFVYREVYETELTPKQQAGVIKRRSTQTVNGRTIKDEVVSPFADPSIFAKAGGGTGKSIALQFAEAGLPMRKAKNDRKGGWMNLRQYLLIDPNAPHAVTKQPGAPKLYIFSTCVNLVRTLPLQMHDDKDPEDLNTKGEDHAVDALRYLLMNRPIRRVLIEAGPATAEDRVRDKWRKVIAQTKKRKPRGAFDLDRV